MRVLFVALTMMSLVPVQAADRDDGYWPEWRGPQGNGVAKQGNPPLEWNETKNVRWKVEVPGKGLSTPVIWGDRIFLTTAVPVKLRPDPEKAEAAESQVPDWRRSQGVAPTHVLRFVAMALDRKSGKVVWERTLREAAPHEGTHQHASWASNSPATNGEHLVVSFGSQGVFGLDLDGNVKWERDLGQMTTRNAFGEGSSPVIHGNNVVINWDHEGPSFITVLDLATGETVWKKDRDEMTSWSTPLIVQVNDKPQIVVSATGKTRAYDLAKGEIVWEAGGMTVNAIPSPVTTDGRVFLASGFRGSMLQAIDLNSASGDVTDKEAIAWTYEQDTPYVPSPVLYDRQIYFLKVNTGILTALDAKTGKEHYARQRLEGIENVYASLVAAAGRVYVVGRNGGSIVVRHGPQFETLAHNKLEDGFDASPAIAGDELFLRGRQHLYCLAEEEASGAASP